MQKHFFDASYWCWPPLTWILAGLSTAAPYTGWKELLIRQEGKQKGGRALSREKVGKKQIWLPVGGDPLFFGLHKKWLVGCGQGNSLIHIRLKKTIYVFFSWKEKEIFMKMIYTWPRAWISANLSLALVLPWTYLLSVSLGLCLLSGRNKNLQNMGLFKSELEKSFC